MKVIKARMGDNTILKVNGYIVDGFGVHHTIGGSGKGWSITDLETGASFTMDFYRTLKEAKAEGVAAAKEAKADYIKRNKKSYDYMVKTFNELVKGNNKALKKESEGKTMTNKTNKTNKGNKASNSKAKKPNAKDAKIKKLEAEIEALKRALEAKNEPPKVTIDTFDIEEYLNTRDNAHRITDALVEAIANTDGLTFTREGADEWLCVRGNTVDDTKTRKEMFKHMGFRWMATKNAWVLAPYPLASAKRYAARKARKAANA